MDNIAVSKMFAASTFKVDICEVGKFLWTCRFMLGKIKKTNIDSEDFSASVFRLEFSKVGQRSCYCRSIRKKEKKQGERAQKKRKHRYASFIQTSLSTVFF
jgi:hypothetical protein